MRKGVIISSILIAMLINASSASAHIPDREYGLCKKRYTNARRANPQKFHKETCTKRDYLIAKRDRMRHEFRKHTLHRRDMAELKKEFMDARSMIQQKSEKAGIYKCNNGIGRQTVHNINVQSPRCQKMGGL